MATRSHIPQIMDENVEINRVGKNMMATRSRTVLADLATNRIIPAGLKKEAKAKPVRGLSKQKGTASLAAEAAPKRTLRRSSRNSQEKTKNEEPMEVEPIKEVEDVEMASYSTVKNVIVDDIDKDDSENPQMVIQYVNEIYCYLHHLEKVQNVEENYLGVATKISITPKMRSVLIDWLVDVHQQFSLLQETLYLSVSLLDRYLQVASGSVPRGMLQLVGITAMFIASKYEEMYAPEIRDFVYIADNTYTVAQIRDTEMKMLRVLDFEMGRPLPLHFLRRNSKAGFVDARIHTLAKYVMELTIVEYKFAHVPPSLLAASALAYSLIVLNEENPEDFTSLWTPTLIHYSGYNFEEIAPLIQELAKYVLKVTNSPPEAKLMAVRKKYGDRKVMKIAQNRQLTSDLSVRLSEGNF